MLNLFRKSAPQETRASTLAAPEDWMIATWTGHVPGSLVLSGPSSLAVPAVAAAVRVISEAVATLDIRVVECDAAARETDVTGHPVAELLRGDANSWTSGFELVRDLVADALIRDQGGLAWVNRVGGEVREIIRYRPGTISAQMDAATGEPAYRLNGALIDANNIVHVRGPFERSPASLAATAIGISGIMETHAGKIFQNGARPSGVIESMKSLGDEGFKKMRAAWQAAMGGVENSGKTAILWDGASFKPLTMNSTDAQFLELRKFQILEIARAFRVPPSMLFELDRATWSNSEQMGKEFLTYCLEPWLKAVEGALRRALFSADERKRFRIVFDRDDLTRADFAARMSAYSSAISSRIINPNEARKWEGMEPYDGGNTFVNPNITTGHNGGPPLGDDE